jgi:hypothetical protein
MANEITIPLLATNSVSETLKFYTALGFDLPADTAQSLRLCEV